jgi:hypothetical protein
MPNTKEEENEEEEEEKLRYSYTYIIFITQLLKSNIIHILWVSPPPSNEHFWVRTCPTLAQLNIICKDIPHKWVFNEAVSTEIKHLTCRPTQWFTHSESRPEPSSTA